MKINTLKSSPSVSDETHVKYAIAHTHDDDSYLLIDEKKGRHPIAFYELKGNVIHWINASGEHESIGGEFPLPDEMIHLAKSKELYIMEMDDKSAISHTFIVNAVLLRL